MRDFFSKECLRNVFLAFFGTLYIKCYYNQDDPGLDEEIISTQKNYLNTLTELLHLCKLLDPSHPQIDELIQKMKEKRAEFYGCKL
jgi:hypothetical protein